MDNRHGTILQRVELELFRDNRKGKTIVFTNGCFDLLHRGHVGLLSTAREFGDLLVVGINSDDSLRRLKGPGRPLMTATDRGYILLQLRSVDYVTVFDEDTPLETIRLLRPDVLVKGAEYARKDIVGADVVENGGGRIERVEMLGSYSTRGLIERIQGMP